MTFDKRAVEIISFWWQQGREKWYDSSAELDLVIAEKFTDLHNLAGQGELDDWRQYPTGALALLILLDQFSRNIYRHKPEAFANDDKALEIAEAAISNNFDLVFPRSHREFFYTAFMHCENIVMQQKCVDLSAARGEKECHYYALIHLDIISRFGRFPHRNKVLGRQSSEAEQRFLDQGGFSA